MSETELATQNRPALPAVALLFLRLGLTAFGGPAAHIAMMQAEVVERRGWMRRDEFLDLLAAANLIPGPSSTELAILIGLRLAGWAGLLLAGTCFIVPAFLMVLALAWAYVRFGTVPQVGSALYGIKPVVIAIVAQALWNLGGTAITSRERALLAGACVVPAALGASPLAILLGAGLAAGARRWLRVRAAAQAAAPSAVRAPRAAHNAVHSAAQSPREATPDAAVGSVSPTAGIALAGATDKEDSGRPINPAPLVAVAAVLTLVVAAPLLQRFGPALSPRYSLAGLFWAFLRLGFVIYGSGYVLLAFLRADLVLQRHWLTNGQLLDSVSIGQVTPGPVFTTATFIGFLLGGAPGAIAATVAIFLPAFLLSALIGPVAERWRRSSLASAMLSGASIASL